MSKVILLPREDGFTAFDPFILEVLIKGHEKMKREKGGIFHSTTKREIKEALLVKCSKSTVSRGLTSLKKKGIIYTVERRNQTNGTCGLSIELKENKVQELLNRYPSKEWVKGENTAFEN